jgi:hypothetical protein
MDHYILMTREEGEHPEVCGPFPSEEAADFWIEEVHDRLSDFGEALTLTFHVTQMSEPWGMLVSLNNRQPEPLEPGELDPRD